jgi:hypothetical protein
MINARSVFLVLIASLNFQISATQPTAAVEYVRISGTITNNSIDPGPNTIRALTPTDSVESVGVASGGSFSLVVPKNTPITLLVKSSSFVFKTRTARIFNENSVITITLPVPTKFTGRVVDAVGNPMINVNIYKKTNANNPYDAMYAALEPLNTSSVWGVVSEVSPTTDSSGVFNLYSYPSSYPEVINVVYKKSGSTIFSTWTSAWVKIESSSSFVACLPVNFGELLTLPSYCSEDMATFGKRSLAEEKAAAADKAAADKAAATTAAKAAANRTTITCVKGKLTKKVTAVKPKCPSGYKKK